MPRNDAPFYSWYSRQLKTYAVLGLITMAVFIGCQPGVPTMPTPSPSPATNATSVPTLTPVLMSTPAPTPTPVPMSTPASTPTPVTTVTPEPTLTPLENEIKDASAALIRSDYTPAAISSCYSKMGNFDGYRRRMSLVKGIFVQPDYQNFGSFYASLVPGAPAEGRRIYGLFEKKEDFRQRAGNVAARIGKALSNEGYDIARYADVAASARLLTTETISLAQWESIKPAVQEYLDHKAKEHEYTLELYRALLPGCDE